MAAHNLLVDEDLNFIINHDLPWEKLYNSTVLITGASGFLASYLVETLLHLNDKKNININIIALARNKEKISTRFQRYRNRSDLKFLIQDVCDPLKLKKEKIDVIIHAASNASPEFYDLDPVGTLSANILGTRNLLELAKKNNVKNFLFFSSGGVYGKIENKKLPVTEIDYGYLDPLEKGSCYGESKRMAETMCVSWARQFKIPIKIVRPGYVYGPGFNLNDKRVFPMFIMNIIKNKDLAVHTNQATRPFCYIADATAAFFTVLLKAKNCEAYNVSAGEERSILELAELLMNMEKQTKSKIIKTFDDKETKSSVIRSAFSIEKIRSLGWTPKTSFEEGVDRTLQFYKGYANEL